MEVDTTRVHRPRSQYSVAAASPPQSAAGNEITRSSNYLSEEHFLLSLELIASSKIRTSALVDSGAMTNITDSDFASSTQYRSTNAMRLETSLDGVDDRSSNRKLLTPPFTNIASHSQSLSYDDGDILGIPRLKQHNPTINWPIYEIRFSSSHCNSHSIPTPLLLLLAVVGAGDDEVSPVSVS